MKTLKTFSSRKDVLLTKNLEVLNLEIRSCTLCDLYQGRILAVPGEGPSHAEIMLVGEAPGNEEDRTGRPFIGRAGKLLNLALNQAGLSREEVYITSVIKCRPPKNRKPKVREVRCCLPYLLSQMELINPRLVCLMGNVAIQAVLGTHGVTELHGKIFQNRYLTTFHPAAVLRNRNLMGPFISDLSKLRGPQRGESH
jgi:uracil-DNA glycosylase family 4